MHNDPARNRLSGTWLLVLAIGILAPLSGQTQEQAQKPQRDAGAEQPPAQTLPIPLPVEIVEDDKTAEARKRREAEARQREIDDLIAQQGMNSATQAMNEATQRMVLYSLAVVKQIYRRVFICQKETDPPPIIYPHAPVEGRLKRNYIPIGPGGRARRIKMRAQDPTWSDSPDARVYFYGYIVYEDVERREYVRGFCLIYAQGVFHDAWPDKKPERYNYERRPTPVWPSCCACYIRPVI